MEEFQIALGRFYQQGRRVLPWREEITPYGVLVSEIMLQQTQVARVKQKYVEWMRAFASLEALANAPLHLVLSHWQGLGYNRRGKYLHETAKILVTQHAAQIPQDERILQQFPGIGYATACSIITFTYNLPKIFIETNIRRVFIHHFFADEDVVADKQIIPLIHQTINHQNPREWYYSLMDYGSYLKKNSYNPNRKSKHYIKQSPFAGSKRQLRSGYLKYALQQGLITLQQAEVFPHANKYSVKDILQELVNEGMLVEDSNLTYKIA